MRDVTNRYACMLLEHMGEVLNEEKPALKANFLRQVNEVTVLDATPYLEQVESLVRYYQKQIPGLYLKIYDKVVLQDFGLYGYAIASSATVRSGLALSQQFLSMTTTRYSELIQEEHGFVTIIPDIDSSSSGAQLLSEDFAAGYLALLKRVVVGARDDLEDLVFEFSYPAPFYSELYRQFFSGCTLKFNQSQTRILLPTHWLSEPISLEHSEVDSLLAVPHSSEGATKELSAIEAKISDIIVGSHFNTITCDSIANELSISARQLRYYLTLYSVNLRDIVLQTRMSMASKLLIDTELDVGTIAETLNYSEASAFVRSFKSFYAISPLQYRLRQSDPFLE
ncbi:AraC family transcriptional regulator [Vibrio maritimus]|uniref:AraC family transcriptional regulator n=1 Tax=Vibrio maritimus TaxID=990268 RepID=UPI001F1A224A|nr:AraC family transcriptional regulator [Vibrio maritimus]